jgi:5S rRNA maturation endonuclease (ribonuclease M5)
LDKNITNKYLIKFNYKSEKISKHINYYLGNMNIFMKKTKLVRVNKYKGNKIKVGKKSKHEIIVYLNDLVTSWIE